MFCHLVQRAQHRPTLCLGGPVASVAVRHVGICVYLLLGLGVRPFYISCQSWPQMLQPRVASLALSTIFFVSTIHHCLRLDCLFPDAPTASLFRCLQCCSLYSINLWFPVCLCVLMLLQSRYFCASQCCSLYSISLWFPVCLCVLMLLQSHYFCALQCHSLYFTSV